MKKKEISILCANILDHYDVALYSFLGPIIAPLFFPKFDAITQLILVYGILASSIITRPLGATIFGYMATKHDPYKILLFTLSGVGITSLLIGILPDFDSIGYMAPLLLLITRSILGIFAAGEASIAGYFLIDAKKNSQAIFTNSLYGSSTILGIIFASFTALIVTQNTWRLPFVFGGILSFAVLFLRFKKSEFKKIEPTIDNKQIEKKSVKTIFAILFSEGFGYLTYEFAFVFINSFIPLVTKITYKEMMSLNTLLLVFDAFMLPVIGYGIKHFDPYKIKIFCAFMLAITVPSLFMFIENASLHYIIFVRFWIVLLGMTFACVQKVYLLNLFTSKKKYLWLGISAAVGSSLFGRSATSICLWLYQLTHLSYAPGLYFAVIAALFLLTVKRKKTIQHSS